MRRYLLFLLLSLVGTVPIAANIYTSRSNAQSAIQNTISSQSNSPQTIVFPYTYINSCSPSFGRSGSKYSSSVQIGVGKSAPPAIRRLTMEDWEDDDDDEDDNYSSTGGQGDGNGNAGDPEKDPMPIGTEWTLMIACAVYILLRKRNLIKDSNNIHSNLCFKFFMVHKKGCV